MKLDWTLLGQALRASALDAHDGELPSVEIAYAFLLDNPDCFTVPGLESFFPGADLDAPYLDDAEWPAGMPHEPNIEVIAAYYAAEAA